MLHFNIVINFFVYQNLILIVNIYKYTFFLNI